jgi:uncharacterized membrane protein
LDAEDPKAIVADDDPRRLAAALGYLFTPIVPIINISGEGNNDKWLRYHSVQALLWSGPFLILFIATLVIFILFISSNIFFICLLPIVILLPFLPGAIWARSVYLGDEVSIPVIGSRVSR